MERANGLPLAVGLVARIVTLEYPALTLRILKPISSFRISAMAEATRINSISLRPVDNDDGTFLLTLYKSSRGEDLRGLGWEEQRVSEFLELQYEAQQRFLESEYKRPTDQLVLRDGEPVGRVLFETREHEIRCIDIALVPAHRNSGIGGQLLRELQNEAKRQRKPLRLQVIRFSRAIGLFERLGFQRISETGTHFQMEWTPE